MPESSFASERVQEKGSSEVKEIRIDCKFFLDGPGRVTFKIQLEDQKSVFQTHGLLTLHRAGASIPWESWERSS